MTQSGIRMITTGFSCGHIYLRVNDTNPFPVHPWGSCILSITSGPHLSPNSTLGSSTNASVFILSSSSSTASIPIHQLSRREVLSGRRAAAKMAAASLKAEELLRSCLSREQDEDLTRRGWFDVPVGDRTYRVKRGSAGNVFLLGQDGSEVEKYCIHPRGVPAADAMLAQKLLLETDERKFRSVANITILRR